MGSKNRGCATGISGRGRLIYTLIMKACKQVGQHEWEEGWNKFWEEEGINNGDKQRKAPPTLWQTGKDIDEEPICNLYNDCEYDGGDGNNVMHDNQIQYVKERSTSARVHNDCDHSEEMAASSSSGRRDDCDQQQSEDALPTSSGDNNDGMEQV